MTQEQKLDLSPLLKKVESSELHNEKLSLVVNSLGCAMIYCGYFWNQYVRTLKSPLTIGWSFRKDDDGYTEKLKCEANILGFLHNLHIICDQFPFALKSSTLIDISITKKGRTEVWNDRDCSWDFNFLRAIESIPNSERLVSKMRAFSTDENFSLLKKIINLSKHRYISEFHVLNSKLVLRVKEFDEVKQVVSCDHDVDALMIKLSNNLMPKIFDLYEEAMKL